MWTRKDVKKRGHEGFKKNYWKAVLVAIILSIVAGSSGGFSGGTSGGFSNVFNNHHIEETTDNDKEAEKLAEEAMKEAEKDNESSKESDKEKDDDTFSFTIDSQDPEGSVNELSDKLADMDDKDSTAFIVIFLVVLSVVFVVIFVLVALMDIFLYNPLQLGCNRFFFKNLDESAGISNVVYAFDHNYKNLVKNLFYRDMYVVLWSLLFVIPGIIKSYEYRMIPYLLAENPDMTKEEVFAESKSLMKGNKWKAFVLDLSFIGWYILSIFTCGILSIFYVNPYKCSTDAALYEALKYGTQE